MKTNIFKAIGICFLFSLCNFSYAAVVIPIEGPAKAFFASKDPTLTMLFEAEKPATATIIFLPGGDGCINLKEGWTKFRSPFFVGIFLPLTKSTFNIVVGDSPYPMDRVRGAATVPNDRLDRIESVVKFYKERIKTPIWLFGHSTGTGQVMEFSNRSAENRQLLYGAILSSTRHEHGLSSDNKFPILFLHHRQDQCPTTTHRDATAAYEKYKQIGNSNSKLVTIEGGADADVGQPCHSGYHMYNGAYQEVVEALEKYLAK